MWNESRVNLALEWIKGTNKEQYERWGSDHTYLDGYYCGLAGHEVTLGKYRRRKDIWLQGYQDGKGDYENS